MAFGKIDHFRLVLFLCVLFGLMQVLPSMVGYATSTPDHVYQGFTFVEDAHAYAAYVNSGVHGNPFFLQDWSTSEPQLGRYIIVYFTILAFVIRLTHLPLDVVWNIFHFLAVTAFMLVAWIFISHIITDKRTRWASWILVGLGGGLGGIAQILGHFIPALARLYSTDLSYPLGYSFVGFAYHALAVFGFIFTLLALMDLLKFFETRTPRYLGWTALFLSIAFFDHPAGGVVAIAAAGFFILIQTIHHYRVKKQIDWLPWAGVLIPIALIAIYTWWARQDPVYAFHQAYYLAWQAKEKLQWYVLGFGFLLLFGAWGAMRGSHAWAQPKARALLLCWLAVAFIASNGLPAGVKYLYMIHFPLAVLAGVGLVACAEWLSQKHALRSHHVHLGIFAALMILLCFSAPFVIGKRVDEVLTQPKHFFSGGENTILLQMQSLPSGVVLSDYRIGSNVSWRTPQLPYIAHGFLTIDFQRKTDELKQFLDAQTSLQWKKDFLSRAHIGYVFYGLDERALGGIDPALGLVPIITSPDATLYRVP